MERRPHPHYARRTFAVSLGLVVGGLSCLFLGIWARRTAYPALETVLDLGFCAAFVALLVYWFSQGESTTCPECGRRLWADPQRNRDESLTFICSDCNIEWDTDAAENVDNSTS